MASEHFQSSSILLGQLLGWHDLDHGIVVSAPAVAGVRHAQPSQPQLGSAYDEFQRRPADGLLEAERHFVLHIASADRLMHLSAAPAATAEDLLEYASARSALGARTAESKNLREVSKINRLALPRGPP